MRRAVECKAKGGRDTRDRIDKEQRATERLGKKRERAGRRIVNKKQGEQGDGAG